MRQNLKRFLMVAALVALPLLALGAGGKASTASNGILNHIFRTTSYTAPTNVYVGLLTVCPYTGNNGTEKTGDGYTARSVAIAKGDSSWTYTAATFVGAASITNAAQVAGSTAWTASGNAWSLCCFGIWDASSGGNLLYWGPLTGSGTINGSGVCSTPIAVSIGATATFATGALAITEN